MLPLKWSHNMNEKTKQFYRDLRKLKDQFIADVSKLCIEYGMDIIPFSFDEIFNIWNPALEKVIDKNFRRKVERKTKKLKKKLNPFWRSVRGWFGK